MFDVPSWALFCISLTVVRSEFFVPRLLSPAEQCELQVYDSCLQLSTLNINSKNILSEIRDMSRIEPFYEIYKHCENS